MQRRGPTLYRNEAADLQDPHWDDGCGPVPRIPPGFEKPPKKVGVRVVWPRDKNRGTWGRLKDLMTGKGPDMYYGRSDRFAPTKATWSNWTEPWYDNLGYRDEHHHLRSAPRSEKYDFKSRRYVSNWMDPKVWSDVKWEPGRNPVEALYWRNAAGEAWSKGAGPLPAPWRSARAQRYAHQNNEYAYHQQTKGWDWRDPAQR